MRDRLTKLATGTLTGVLVLLLPLSVSAASLSRRMSDFHKYNKTGINTSSGKISKGTSNRETPSISIINKKHPSNADLRCMQLLKAGKSKTAKETKIGFAPEAGHKKGEKIQVKSFPLKKPQKTILNKKRISRKGRIAIQRKDYFRKSFTTSARKPIFKDTGLGNRTIKATTFTLKDLRVPKAKARRPMPKEYSRQSTKRSSQLNRSSISIGGGKVTAGNGIVIPGGRVRTTPDLSIMSVK